MHTLETVKFGGQLFVLEYLCVLWISIVSEFVYSAKRGRAYIRHIIRFRNCVYNIRYCRDILCHIWNVSIFVWLRIFKINSELRTKCL